MIMYTTNTALKTKISVAIVKRWPESAPGGWARLRQSQKSREQSVQCLYEVLGMTKTTPLTGVGCIKRGRIGCGSAICVARQAGRRRPETKRMPGAKSATAPFQ